MKQLIKGIKLGILLVIAVCLLDKNMVLKVEATNVTPETEINQPTEDGLIINALGDSIVFGEEASSQEKVFITLLGNMVGASKINNYGLPGSTLAGPHPNRLLDRYSTMEPNADVVIVMGGTNDYGYDVELGNFGDATDQTFYGGVNLLMVGLHEMYPNARIIYLTPMKRYAYLRRNKNGNQLIDYVNAVLQVGEYYGVEVIDMYSPESLFFLGKNRNLMEDGLHPNDQGNEIMANYLFDVLVNPS